MDYLKNGVAGSIMTANEARRKLDLPDSDGGNVLLANGNIVPLTQAGAAYRQTSQTQENEKQEEQTGPDEIDPDKTDDEKDKDTAGGGEE
jgi:hypothetical protein